MGDSGAGRARGTEGRVGHSHPPALGLTEAAAPSPSSPAPLSHRRPPHKTSPAYWPLCKKNPHVDPHTTLRNLSRPSTSDLQSQENQEGTGGEEGKSTGAGLALAGRDKGFIPEGPPRLSQQAPHPSSRLRSPP